MAIVSSPSFHGSILLGSWNLKSINNIDIETVPFFKHAYDNRHSQRVSENINMFNNETLIMKLPYENFIIFPHPIVNFSKDKSYICLMNNVESSSPGGGISHSSMFSYFTLYDNKVVYSDFTVPMFNLKCRLIVRVDRISSAIFMDLHIHGDSNNDQPSVNIKNVKYTFLLNIYQSEDYLYDSLFSRESIGSSSSYSYAPAIMCHLTEIENDSLEIVRECMFVGLESLTSVFVNESIKKVK